MTQILVGPKNPKIVFKSLLQIYDTSLTLCQHQLYINKEASMLTATDCFLSTGMSQIKV
jgi:hypothetical protein